MSVSIKIVRNTLANYGGNVVGLVVGFVLTPFLIHSLGDSQYGAWVLVGSISSYFWMFDFGLGASVIKFVSEYKTKGEQEKLNIIVANSFAMLAVIGLFALVGCVILAQIVDLFFQLPPDLTPDVRTMVYITGVSMAFSFPFGVFGGVLRGYQRYDLVNAVGVVSVVGNALMSLAVVKWNFGLVGLSVVGLLTNLMVVGGRLTLAKREDPLLALKPSMVRLFALREIVSFSFWVLVINMAVQVVYRTAPIIIAMLLNVALVTPYAIANSLVQYVKRCIDPILAVLLPAYTELSASDEKPRLQNLLLEGSRIVGALAMPLIMLLYLLGDPFIALWVGRGYETSYHLICLLAAPVFISFLVASGDKLLWAKGKIRVNSYVAMADSCINLFSSLLLTKTIGVLGVGLATLISVGLTNGCWLLPYICREAGVSYSRYLADVIKPIFVPMVPSAGLSLLLIQLVGTGSYMHLAIIGGSCVMTYWGVFLILSRKEEKERWIGAIRSALIASKARSVGGLA